MPESNTLTTRLSSHPSDSWYLFNAEGQTKVTLISGGDVEHVLVRGVVVQRRRQTDIAGAAPDGDRQAGGSTDRVDQGSPIHGLTGLAVSTTWITRLNLQSANNNNRLVHST